MRGPSVAAAPARLLRALPAAPAQRGLGGADGEHDLIAAIREQGLVVTHGGNGSCGASGRKASPTVQVRAGHQLREMHNWFGGEGLSGDNRSLTTARRARLPVDVATDQSFFRTQAQVQMEFAVRVLAAAGLPVALDGTYELLTSEKTLKDTMARIAKRKAPESRESDHVQSRRRGQCKDRRGHTRQAEGEEADLRLQRGPPHFALDR